STVREGRVRGPQWPVHPDVQRCSGRDPGNLQHGDGLRHANPAGGPLGRRDLSSGHGCACAGPGAGRHPRGRVCGGRGDVEPGAWSSTGFAGDASEGVVLMEYRADPGWHDEIDVDVRKWFHNILLDIGTDAEMLAPVDTGALKQSIKVEEAGDTGYIGSDLDYSVWVEEG